MPDLTPQQAESDERDLYPEAQFLADLKKASAPMKRLADEALAEHKAMKARSEEPAKTAV